jgi:hypothetical protein
VSPSREEQAQQGPPSDLDGFPVHRLAPRTTLHRAHLSSNGPWWFGSEGGRFDLDRPRGTCYLATSAVAALRERLGPVLARRATLPASTLEDVVVSRLQLARPDEGRTADGRVGDGAPRLANLRSSRAALFGVTRELESMTPYDVPRSWARAFDAVGLDGIRYGPRFSPGAASAVAVFGPAGVDTSRPVDREPVPAQQVPRSPAVVPIPRRSELSVIAPPRRGRPR